MFIFIYIYTNRYSLRVEGYNYNNTTTQPTTTHVTNIMPLTETVLCWIMCALELCNPPEMEDLGFGSMTIHKRPILLELIRQRCSTTIIHDNDHDTSSTDTYAYHGFLYTVLELDLQNDGIQKIGPVLGRACPNVQRLLLHNNIIDDLDGRNWRRFKALQVLVLALNNLNSLEELMGYISTLEYLDASFNIIDIMGLQASMPFLKSLPRLKELYLVGNPCELEWEGYRYYILGSLPLLQRFDGRSIGNEERQSSLQQLDFWEKNLQERIGLIPIRCSEMERKEREREAIYELLYDDD